MAYVYILQSLKNKRYYIGSTRNINQRFLAHKSGNVKATKNLLPLKIVFRQEFSDINTAKNIERRLKELKHKDYIVKIIEDGKIRIAGG